MASFSVLICQRYVLDP